MSQALCCGGLYECKFNEFKVTPTLRAIICGSHKYLTCMGFQRHYVPASQSDPLNKTNLAQNIACFCF